MFVLLKAVPESVNLTFLDFPAVLFSILSTQAGSL